MTETRDNGGPAFPIPGLHNDADFNGMSLRDYFAAKAMQAAATNPVGAEGFTSEERAAWAYARAAWAYAQADAMLEARK